MKYALSALFLLAISGGYAYAQGEVYLCVDGNGVKEYKNVGPTARCKKMDLPPLTIASPTKHASPIQTASARTSSATPSDFPRVDSAIQQTRDNDRKQILLDELKREENKLTDLQKGYNNGEPVRGTDERDSAKYQGRVNAMKDDVGRSEKNVQALKRELGNLK
ncbi:MAG: DUF4124 domain-containing protein [Herbaspirillum sp.]